MDKIKLKAYLKCLYELEASLYFQQQVYSAVFQEQQRALSSYKVEQEIPYSTPESKKYDSEKWVGLAFGLLGVIVFILSLVFGYNDEVNIYGLFFSSLIKGAIAGGIAAIIVVMIIRFLENKSELQGVQQSTIENREIDRKNEQIRARNADSKVLARRKGAAIEVRLNEIQQGINETRKTLEQYYGLDIVFEKYRNFVAISSIYEYFASERCQELGGPYGAYNKFEEELRQNLIIAKLDDVLRSLSRIEKNQIMLYNAIMETNRELRQIRRGIDGISSSIQRIESNSEITAYNSRIAAENTEYMKNLQTYDILTRR